jgi:hypothetical protein
MFCVLGAELVAAYSDTHAAFQAAQMVFARINWRMRNLEAATRRRIAAVVNLGDFYDKGTDPLENLVFVWEMTVWAPVGYHVLRGNHEVREPTYSYSIILTTSHLMPACGSVAYGPWWLA